MSVEASLQISIFLTLDTNGSNSRFSDVSTIERVGEVVTGLLAKFADRMALITPDLVSRAHSFCLHQVCTPIRVTVLKCNCKKFETFWCRY